MKVYTNKQIELAFWVINSVQKEYLAVTDEKEDIYKSCIKSLDALAEILRRCDIIDLIANQNSDE